MTKNSSARREAGGSQGINYKSTPEWDIRAVELTDGIGVDKVVEVGGGGTFARSLNAIRHGGYVAVIGALSGGKQEMDIRPILMKSAHVQGIYVGSREMFAAMNRAITQHQIRPIVDRVFGFDEVKAAPGTHAERGALRQNRDPRGLIAC